MADKIKKVSINAFEKAVASQYEPTNSIEWNGITIIIKRNLSLKEMMSFVDYVVKSCFDDDGAYMPEIKDFAIRSCIIEYYTNISLPSNIEKRYELLYHHMILDSIMLNIDTLQFNAMIRSIEDKVSNIANARIEAVTKQMNELYSSIDNIQQQFALAFNGVDSSELNNLIKVLGSSSIDEKKIVDAIISYKKEREE